MKTKIKRHSRSVISVLLAVCMLISCMTAAMIATDAAKTEGETVGANADSEMVGYTYSESYLRSDLTDWTTGTQFDSNGEVTVDVTAYQGQTVYFYVRAGQDRLAAGETAGSMVNNSEWNIGTQSWTNPTVKYKVGDNATSATFKLTLGSNTKIKITETTASAQTTTWSVAGCTGGQTTGGQTDALFTETWNTNLTQNEMTNTSGTTWTWSKNNVTLPEGKILCKVVKNHSYDTAFPAGNNQESAALTAGEYNVTITFDSNTREVTITATQVVKSTLSVASTIEKTEAVTATYNGTTVGKGGSISNIPEGAAVTITVTPSTGYKCSGITSSGGGTIKGSVNTYTLIMPAQNTEVSANTATVEIKKIYFNNNYTQYGTVYAYVYDKDGTNHTYEYLGAKPGKVMIESANSEIWYIEVPNDVDYVEFISGDGKTTGEMKIPWPDSGESTTYDYPKYTAPYNYDAPTIANGGTWGNYIWGDKVGDARDNVYTVTDGETMDVKTHPNLFTGINATLYDYYTNGEIAASAGTDSDTGASGAPAGWLKGIASNEYNPGGGTGNLWLPYENLNGALIGYADTTSQPKYDITYPLYFGNLNYATKDGYYHYYQKANNSVPLTYSSNAVTGLSGKTLANGSIHYYDADDTTNENGAPMAMFNEDFLSGENSEGKPLATILRTSSFPVRKTTSAAGYHKIYFDASSVSWWNNGNVTTKAHFWDSTNTSDTLDVVMTQDQTNKFIYSTDRVDSKYNKVIFYRGSWNNQTDDLVVPAVTDTNLCYQLNNKFHGDNNKYCYGSWTTNSDAVYYNASHVYYEFDSTNGKDNAYITDINKSDKTAKINYYYDSYKTKTGAGAGDPYGFFPFDYNTYQNNANNSSKIAHDLGFGMKLEIPFTLEANGKFSNNDPQEFNFSGDDDLWVFVDGKLVLDLGGAHGRTTGTINFNTKEITYTMTESIGSATRNDDFTWFDNTNPNYVHTMTIYYMERGMFDSNLKFGFSFHAIPNQFWIDKKIRTKDKDNLGYDTINAGFFNKNNQAGDANNMTTYTVGGKTTTMSKFERSFQNEKFMVTHWYGNPTADTLAENKNYTIDNDTTTHTVGSDGQYPIYHDLGNAFIGQFTTGQQFKLKEEPDGSNKYVYQPVFSVWDQANNDKKIQPNGDNTNGYTFEFSPTTGVSGGIENTNIKARFENYMVAHNLTLKKEITNATDLTTDFTFQILFDFSTSGTANYVSFPLYCYVDGVRTKLSDTGTIAVKAGQVVVIDEIPEKAKVQVTEVLTDTVSGYRYAGVELKNGATVLTENTDYNPVTKGIKFQMGNADMSAVFSNKKPDNKYTITYNYPSYGASPKTQSLYGMQSYTVSGVFTKNELDTYMMLSNGALDFKTPTAKRTFINNKAPYEKNFMQDLSFASSTIDESGAGWDNNGDYSCSLTATGDPDYTINAYFDLPYEVEGDLIPKESGTTGKVAYSDTKRSYGSKDITCFDWYVTSGPSNKQGEGTPTFVKAPLILYPDTSTDTAKYFQYWSVKSQSAYGKQSTEYTRCYDYEFNFALFMDSVIEPIYDDTWAQPPATGPKNYKDYERYNPEIQIQGNDIGINIAFLENSRNQYNNNGGNGRSGAAADVIYSDFLLNFNYNATDGLLQLNQLAENTKKAGLVIEAVDYMDYEVENGNTTTNFDFNKNYSGVEKFTNTDTQTHRNAITGWLQGGEQVEHCVKSQFDVRALDNKNCKQYYYALNNRKFSNGQLLNTTQNRYKVFRAYAYIGDVVENQAGLEHVKLSDPVYFTIYDVGSQRLTDNRTK